MKGIFSALGPEGFGNYEIDLHTGIWERISKSPQGLLVPGFVDVHIHGAYGIDFMSATDEEFGIWRDKLEAEGYEAFLPTTVTASAGDVLQAISKLPDDPMVPGFHLEGPFISPVFPGAQPPEAISEIPEGPSEWDEIFDHPKLKFVTLAPELPGATSLALRLKSRGVVVSMGHTNATYAEARTGFVSGVSQATHTFNAMRPLHHREAGTVGYALANDALTCELIYDRLHVCREAATVLVKCKPWERIIAVSDGTMAVGLSPGQTINMWGLHAIVGSHQVRLVDGTLAGSAITLLDAFRNLAEDFGPELAIRACCDNPRRVLGLGEPTVYLEFDRDLKLVRKHKATF